MTDPQVFVSAGDLMAQLGVSGSTFRRISADYETVFGVLGRDANNRRVWTVDAARLVVAAHTAVKAGQADSTRAALEKLRDGEALPVRADLPPTLDVGRALADLADLVQRQNAGTVELLGQLDARDAEIAGALRALGDAQRAQADRLADLVAQVAAMQDQAARPAPTPDARPRGLLARLLAALGII